MLTDYVLAGAAMFFAVLRARLTLHTHFNHNDLFHLIQIPALYLFLRGGLLLTDHKEKAVQDS